MSGQWEARTIDPIPAELVVADRLTVIVTNTDDGALTAEQAEHRDAAVAAARTIAELFGGEVRVAVSGHANPGHAPRIDLPDEHVTITVWATPTPPSSED